MHVRLVIRALGQGGTERQLVLMSGGLVERGHRVSVVSFFEDDLVGGELRSLGAETECLRLRGRGDVVRAAAGGIRAVLRSRPDVLYSFNAESDLLALAAGRLAPGTAVVWGLQTVELARFAVDRPAGALVALHERLAGRPDLVVASSRAGFAEALEAGYPRDRLRLVENAVDTRAFERDEGLRAAVRAELGGPEILVGVVARLAPAKDHRTFLAAAALVAARRPEISFVCVGDGEPAYRDGLGRLADELGLGARLRWLGVRSDMQAIHSALDVLVLAPAWGEAMPVAVGEAMAAGVVPVVSDQADLPRLVGDLGVVVPKGDPAALAAGIEQAVARRGSAAGLRARAGRLYSLGRMVAGTEGVLSEAVALRRSR